MGSIDRRQLDTLRGQLRTAYALVGKILERKLVPGMWNDSFSAEELAVVGMTSLDEEEFGPPTLGHVISVVSALVEGLAPYVADQEKEPLQGSLWVAPRCCGWRVHVATLG